MCHMQLVRVLHLYRFVTQLTSTFVQQLSKFHLLQSTCVDLARQLLYHQSPKMSPGVNLTVLCSSLLHLQVCDDSQRQLLMSCITAHLTQLKKLTYGKHIVARIEKLLAAGNAAAIQQVCALKHNVMMPKTSSYIGPTDAALLSH